MRLSTSSNSSHAPLTKEIKLTPFLLHETCLENHLFYWDLIVNDVVLTCDIFLKHMLFYYLNFVCQPTMNHRIFGISIYIGPINDFL